MATGKSASSKKTAPKKAVSKTAASKAAPKTTAKSSTKVSAKAAPTTAKAVAKPSPKATSKASAAKPAATKKAAPKAAAAKTTPKTARKPNSAFMKPLQLSAELASVIGSGKFPRTEVIKKIWEYIKKNDLQDGANKRMINADEKLKGVFGGKKQVSMFEMTKLISNHLE